MIRPLTRADVPWAARQHAALMKGSVFAAFGVGFLACFYDRFARSAHAVSFVDELGGTPVGVIASTSNRPAFLRGLLGRHGLRLAAYAAAGLLRPECRRLLRQAPGYPRRGAGGPIAAELVFITVDPAHRGAGVAARLIEAALAELVQRGVPAVCVTIESANAVIRRRLLDAGFAVVRPFTFAGKPNELLEKRLFARVRAEPAENRGGKASPSPPSAHSASPARNPEHVRAEPAENRGEEVSDAAQ